MSEPLFILPWPPSVNVYWRSLCFGGRSRVVISEAGNKYRVDVQAAVLQRFSTPFKPIAGKIAVHIEACQPNHLRRDLDNLLKAPLDALTHARVWNDDSQISRLSIEWGPIRKPGEVRVSIDRVVDPEQPSLFGGA